jgi:hypothetical protein
MRDDKGASMERMATRPSPVPSECCGMTDDYPTILMTTQTLNLEPSPTTTDCLFVCLRFNLDIQPGQQY